MSKIYKFLTTVAFMWLSVGWAWAQYTVSGSVSDERTGGTLNWSEYNSKRNN
jgi:hypothetical protein